MDLSQPEQLRLFDVVTEYRIEASFVETGEVFMKVQLDQNAARQRLMILKNVAVLLMQSGMEVPDTSPDQHGRVYGKYIGKLIVVQVLSSQKYIYPEDDNNDNST